VTSSRMTVEEVRQHFLMPELEVRHTRFSPLLLIGQHRSGTTILGSLIRKYLKVNFGPESQFFFRFADRLSDYGNLEDDDSCRRLIADIAAERCFALNQFGFSVDVDATLQRLDQRSYAGIIDRIFSDFADHNGMQRWGDKTPEYVLHLPALYALFPDAQYIHIARDGRDVALSNSKVFFGAKNATVAALDWRQYACLVQSFAAELPPENFFECRYEDLMSDPVGVFESVARFLGVRDDDETLFDTIRERLPGELKADNFNKWKTAMSAAERRRFEQIAGVQLAEYGYEREFLDAPDMSPVAIAGWRFHHLVKKYLSPGAWRDNLYKLALRAKSLSRRVLGL